MNEQILQELSKPFHPSHITWKPGAMNGKKDSALALAYADLRAYQVRLDEACGMDWSVSYTPWGERIICHLTVNGVTRSSTGEPDSDSDRNENSGTVSEAQAFKRACAMFGLGRYLYNLPSLWIEYDAAKKSFTEKGKARLHSVVAQHYQRFLDEQGLPPTVDHRQPEPTGVDTEIDAINVQSTEEVNPFNDPTVGARAETPIDPALQKKLNILNSLGNTFYNKSKNDKAWDGRREELAKAFGVASSTELTGEQLDRLIAGLESRVRQVLAQMGGVPADIVAECTAYGKFAGVDTTDKAKGVGLAKCLQWAKANLVPA